MTDSPQINEVRALLQASGIPGAVATWGDATEIRASVATGVTREGGPETTTDTRFDLASLTKVVATLPAVLQLASEGRLDLEEPLSTYFGNAGSGQEPSLGDVTPRQLLAHNSGLPAFSRVHTVTRDRLIALAGTLHTALFSEPGGTATYSDPGFMLLGALVERVSGQRLDEYVQERILEPLQMHETHYNPIGTEPEPAQYAATEFCGWRNRLLEGEVHDENCFAWEGVSGHAGLFGTSADLARYCQAWLRADDVLGSRDLQLEAQQLQAETGSGERRGLGWVLAPAAIAGGKPGFGHTGFTGTSLWISGDRFAVLLTNRVHPHRQRHQAMTELRAAFHELVL